MRAAAQLFAVFQSASQQKWIWTPTQRWLTGTNERPCY